MAEELYDVLRRFHHEVVRPDIQQIVQQVVHDHVSAEVGALRGEMLDHFDALYHRMLNIEREYDALKAGSWRAEDRLNAFERGDGSLAEVKEHVAQLEDRLRNYEGWIDYAERNQHYDALRAELDELNILFADLAARLARVEAQITHS
jgi:predicted  nucleic acid-binding Zn-ribbon protein